MPTLRVKNFRPEANPHKVCCILAGLFFACIWRTVFPGGKAQFFWQLEIQQRRERPQRADLSSDGSWTLGRRARNGRSRNGRPRRETHFRKWRRSGQSGNDGGCGIVDASTGGAQTGGQSLYEIRRELKNFGVPTHYRRKIEPEPTARRNHSEIQDPLGQESADHQIDFGRSHGFHGDY